MTRFDVLKSRADRLGLNISSAGGDFVVLDGAKMSERNADIALRVAETAASVARERILERVALCGCFDFYGRDLIEPDPTCCNCEGLGIRLVS